MCRSGRFRTAAAYSRNYGRLLFEGPQHSDVDNIPGCQKQNGSVFGVVFANPHAIGILGPGIGQLLPQKGLINACRVLQRERNTASVPSRWSVMFQVARREVKGGRLDKVVGAPENRISDCYAIMP